MPRELFVRVRGGARICVPHDLANITTFVLLEQEAWFEPELEFAAGCLSPGQIAVDVGANLGVFTTALARRAGPSGRILAFEPTAATAARLRRTLEAGRLSGVDLFQAALSDRSGAGRLRIAGSPELNALTEEAAGDEDSEAVNLLTLDGVLKAHVPAGKLALVKIDAEGHELRVVRGAERTLERHEPLLLFEVRHGGGMDDSLLRHLRGRGYGIYRLVPGLGLLAPLAAGETPDDYELNLFACTPARAAALRAASLLIERSGPFQAPHMPDDHQRALACHAAASGGQLPPEQAHAALALAHELAQRACAASRTVARLFTLARTALDLGRRTAAVAALAEAVNACQQPGARLEEPCLAPHLRYDTLPAADDPGEWMQCAALESYQRLATWSSLFQGPGALPLLDSLSRRPYHCAEMERRRQLLRMRSGAQDGPQPHPLLASAAPDNLNPDYWCRQAAGGDAAPLR